MNQIFNHKAIVTAILIAVNVLFFAQSNVYSQQQPTFTDLLTVDPRGGTVIRFPGFDLTKRNAPWKGWFNMAMVYVPNVSGSYGCYQGTSAANFQEGPAMVLKPNRTYIVSALIRTNFKDRSASEVSMFINEWMANKSGILYQRPMGVPAHTSQTADGWARFEVEYTTTGITDVKLYTFNLNLYGKFGGADNLFQIADVALVEMPEKPLIPYAKGDGVKFRGGPGKIPIKVESVKDSASLITVVTTAAEYVFDKENSTISAKQRIDMVRQVAAWTSSVSLNNLSIISQNDTVAVLANSDITFGIQCDGLLMMSPQADVEFTLQSLIGGKWNRLRDGYLMVQDDFGGMTVHPAIPDGSGRLPRYTSLDALDFGGFKSIGIAAPYGKDQIWQQKSDDRLSLQEPGWKVKWSLSPGERLGFSVSPVRPFDWDASFNQHYSLFGNWNNSASAIQSSPANIYTLWDVTERAYAASYGRVTAKQTINENVSLLHGKGKSVLGYISSYFHLTRDPQEYIKNVKEWKDLYNIDGIYSDGLATEWLIAYEEMRMLRELFPDGILQIHDTGTWGNGGSPNSASDFASPFITAYSDATISAEATSPTNQTDPAWTYARYMGTKFRQGNSPVGIMKGGYWKLSQINIAKISLVYGGRAWIDLLDPDQYKSQYLPMLNKLKDLWVQKGNDPYFYDRYYLPKAQSITGYKLGRAGMPIENISGRFPGTITVSLATFLNGGAIHYTTDGTEPTSLSDVYSSPLSFTKETTLKAVTIEDGLDESRILTLDISSKTMETAILDKSAKGNLYVYPNPVQLNSQLKIGSGSDKSSLVIISDLQGRRVYESKFRSQLVFSPEEIKLKVGFYLVNVVAEGKGNVTKLVVL